MTAYNKHYTHRGIGKSHFLRKRQKNSPKLPFNPHKQTCMTYNFVL